MPILVCISSENCGISWYGLFSIQQFLSDFWDFFQNLEYFSTLIMITSSLVNYIIICDAVISKQTEIMNKISYTPTIAVMSEQTEAMNKISDTPTIFPLSNYIESTSYLCKNV